MVQINFYPSGPSGDQAIRVLVTALEPSEEDDKTVKHLFVICKCAIQVWTPSKTFLRQTTLMDVIEGWMEDPFKF